MLSPYSDAKDPAFWRAGAISTTVVMLVVLIFLTIDSHEAIRAGGTHVAPYAVINREIGYVFDVQRSYNVPVIGGEQLLFGRKYTEPEARALISRGKLVIQSRACMDCHTFFGNGAYYGPDLTKAWLDPVWERTWMPMTQQTTREAAMVEFLMRPDKYPNWGRQMPNLDITRDEAIALVAYLKWMSAVDANGFPANFGMVMTESRAVPPTPAAPGLRGTAPESAALSPADLAAAGQKAYSTHCVACHQANGEGIAAAFPPLGAGQPFAGSDALLKPLQERGFYKDGKITLGSVKQHLDVVMNGIPGTAMPPFASQLDDETVAAIVTYERNAFGNKTGDVVNPGDAKALRASR